MQTPLSGTYRATPSTTSGYSRLSKAGVYGNSIATKHGHLGTTKRLPREQDKYKNGHISAVSVRNYEKEIETLRKELDRKDQRNVNISAEISNLRTAYSNQERELRILSGTFEKCNNERLRLSNECSRNKEYIDKLELQLTRLGDLQALAVNYDKAQVTNDKLAGDVKNMTALMETKDNKIYILEKELEAFHRSIELKEQYEGANSSLKSSRGGESSVGDITTSEHANMKTLYYELGKKQTDAHSLALSLASTNKDLTKWRDKCTTLSADKDALTQEVQNLRNNLSAVNQQSLRDKDEIGDLLEKNNVLKSNNSRLSGQLEDISKRLREERQAYTAFKGEKDSNEDELVSTLQSANKEIGHMRNRISNLQQSITLIENKRVQAEEKLVAEMKNMEAERGVYAKKISENMKYKEASVRLSQQLQEALKSQDEQTSLVQANTAQDVSIQYEEKLNTMQDALNQSRTHEKELLRDRDSSVRALQQTVEATRELSNRCNEEKAKRIAAEERCKAAEMRALAAEQGVRQATEHHQQVSQAFVDSMRNTGNTTAAGGTGGVPGSPGKNVSFKNINNMRTSNDSGIVSEADIFDNFAPPLPPSSNQYNEHDTSFSAHSSGEGSFGSDNHAINTSTGDELARLREELKQMEQNRP